ncbi:MAG: uracil-DNA glycosylase family protein [Nitrososphaerota archaeon]
MAALFDKGPPAALARHFAKVPDPPVKDDFWFDWGPVFYRGRLDGSARVLCLASDPGPTERIAGRSLVGNAGQRVQGLLAKLGLTESYVCLNAWAYALHPSAAWPEMRKLKEPDQLKWRNRLYDLATGAALQAIVALGGMAEEALALWTERPDVPVKEVPHPSSRDEKRLLDEWRAAVADLRAVVTPDPDGDPTGPNYGSKFAEADYAPIPRIDLPFGAPPFLGDDSWVRTTSRAQNSVSRPSPDDAHTLIWHAPKSPA